MHLRISKSLYTKDGTIYTRKKKAVKSSLQKETPRKRGRPRKSSTKYDTKDSICLRLKKRISYYNTCIPTKYRKRRGKKFATKEIKSSTKVKKLARSLQSSKTIVKNKNENSDEFVNYNDNDTIMNVESNDNSIVFLSQKNNDNNASLDTDQHVEDNLPLLNLRCVNQKTGETQFGIPLHKRFIPYIEPLMRKSPSRVSIITIASDKTEDKFQQQGTNIEEEAYLKEFVKMLEITHEDGNFIDSFDNQNALPKTDDNYFWI